MSDALRLRGTMLQWQFYGSIQHRQSYFWIFRYVVWFIRSLNSEKHIKNLLVYKYSLKPLNCGLNLLPIYRLHLIKSFPIVPNELKAPIQYLDKSSELESVVPLVGLDVGVEECGVARHGARHQASISPPDGHQGVRELVHHSTLAELA